MVFRCVLGRRKVLDPLFQERSGHLVRLQVPDLARAACLELGHACSQLVELVGLLVDSLPEIGNDQFPMAART